LVFSTDIPLFFSIALSLILGISLELNSPVSESSLYYALYNLLGNVLAISLVAKVNLRGSLLKVGTFLGLANTLLVTFILFVQYGYQIMGYPREIFFSLLFTFLGGGFSGFVVVGLMPIIESFGYVTDIKFLELANTNHPLLTRLAIEAPGTSHHSFIVSRLAEAAAEAISGNALYARVASLYHDIGKTFKPDYFVENQKSGENKHDHIAPRMSSLIIQSHVKDGIELAKKYKLPQSIIDAIPQHHGTSLITYFYSKAKKLENPQMDSVDENDYRYPGPKPKSRECAVIMLADATEAATRSLDEPTPTKISGVVDMIIHKFFSDGQLTQCELTLTDLNTIGESFVKVLSTSIYHQRVKYPGQKERTPRSTAHSS
jgi:putative nucleotidyltransferase with HDIG domain